MIIIESQIWCVCQPASGRRNAIDRVSVKVT
jgi:hypothetical protein